MPKRKINLDLRKRIAVAHKAGNGNTKLVQRLEVSEIEVSATQYRISLAEVGN